MHLSSCKAGGLSDDPLRMALLVQPYWQSPASTPNQPFWSPAPRLPGTPSTPSPLSPVPIDQPSSGLPSAHPSEPSAIAPTPAAAAAAAATAAIAVAETGKSVISSRSSWRRANPHPIPALHTFNQSVAPFVPGCRRCSLPLPASLSFSLSLPLPFPLLPPKPVCLPPTARPHRVNSIPVRYWSAWFGPRARSPTPSTPHSEVSLPQAYHPARPHTVPPPRSSPVATRPCPAIFAIAARLFFLGPSQSSCHSNDSRPPPCVASILIQSIQSDHNIPARTPSSSLSNG